METLLEFYDKDVLKNIMAVLTLRPKKVIFLYDKEIQDLTCFRSLEKCFQRHMPQIKLETYPINILSLNQIYSTTCRLIEREGAEGFAMELTGGSELMMIAGYKAGSEKGVKLLYTELASKSILDLDREEVVAKTIQLTLEDFVDARGACFIGESHKPPAEDRYDAILRMARYLFRHLFEWKPTCSFLQVVVSRLQPNEMYVNSKKQVSMKNGKKAWANEHILLELERNGFISGLVIEEHRVRFRFTSKENKQYCINYGVWLELYVYVSAARSGAFQDVKLGTMIDWDAYDGVTMAGNEIDVILMEDSLPVFISCKLRDADTAALNELLIAKKRLGGWFSKGVIVTYSREKREHTGTYKRAQELGLELLDADDILAEDFEQRLVDTIKGHDLVSLKWKKV